MYFSYPVRLKKVYFRRSSTLKPLIRFSFQTNKALSIQRRGSEFALIQLANHMGSSLPSKLPKLWEAIVGPLQQINTGNSFGKNHHILQCTLINEILFELRIETILMLMIFAVILF